VSAPLRQTPLHDAQAAIGARMVAYAGWEMPVRYDGVIAEHLAVRSAVGAFDVSHMGEIETTGPGALELLMLLCTNDVARVPIGGAQYSLLCREDGGVLDDVFSYRLEAERYLTVTNAANHERDLAWFRSHAGGFDAQVIDRAADYAMIAVQGPLAREVVQAIASAPLPERMTIGARTINGAEALVAATGYTGEDGFEIIVPEAQVIALWNKLKSAGVAPAGLGARDTLRLEAGMNLYGQDMDETITPWEANLGWTVALDEGRNFIGRGVLEKQKADGGHRVMVGLVMDDKGVLRHGQRVVTPNGDGEILSGSFSPTLGKSIAFARVPAGTSGTLQADIRGKLVPVRVVKYPFVRDGNACDGV